MIIRRLIHRPIRLVLLLIFLSLPIACHDHSAARRHSFEPSPRTSGVLEQELDATLKALRPKGMTISERVEYFARRDLNQRYKLGLLGEFPVELHDADPLYDLTASDCVTFVEQTYAKALSDDWPSFFQTLMQLRYKGGRIGMLTRNHFTEADWNTNNAWAFDDVTSEVASGATEPMRVRVDRAAFFKKYDLGGDIPVEIVNTVYIARESLADVDQNLKTGDIIEFVRGTSAAPYVGHLGLIAGRVNGRANLIHSGAPRVRELPLMDYVKGQPKILGIKVLRCRIESPLES